MTRNSYRGSDSSLSSQYRRGTIIGLTLAEMFVLITFILILLLGLWKVQETEKMERLMKGIADVPAADLPILTELVISGVAAPLAENKGLQELVITVSQLSKPEQATFVELVRASGAENMEALSRLVSSGLAAPLVESRDLQELVESISALPKTDQSSFVELVRGSGYKEVVSWAHNISAAIEEGSSVEAMADMLELLKEHSAAEVRETLELAKRYDLSVLTQTAQKADEIEALLGRSDDASKRFATELQNRAGAIVRNLGGNIDAATGDVTLPETALFQQGSATLTDHTRSVLNSFCFPWLDTARRSTDIEELKIEGHASSEWNEGDSEAMAFVQNMHLSQARASRVLEYCLGNAESIELEQWARARLVGVGYSSAKVIRDEGGIELPGPSRRVVFRAGIDHSRLINSIETKVQE